MEKKRKIIQAAICVGLVCFVWGGYVYGMKKITQIIKYELKDDFSWSVQVDEVEVRENELVLTGFAFKLNTDAKDGAYSIILHNLDTGEYLFPKMEYEERKEVNEYFMCRYDYTDSGFIATIKTRKLDLEGNDYEVLLLPEDTRKPYRIATYLSDGILMYANPKEYVPLEVEGTDLEEIVKNGVLRVYRPDMGAYVYQYDGSLFWIVESSYSFEEDGSSVMECQIDTTQKEKLPQHRIENGWLWDNIGFVFEHSEVKDLYCGNYRVAKADLPKEYSISKIWTGYYNEAWIWMSEFRSRYYFD